MGAFFHSFGQIEWQWSAVQREKVEAVHGPWRTAEVALAYWCMGRAKSADGRFDYCEQPEISFIPNGTIAFKARVAFR